ncbi:hypothetical protein RJT34_12519 [Clitoria ternatea]|uniref:Uncharacterized protein n=1 Tax=Clitoria ternatea TaxID=43366 RepID=A0AAN9JNZ7_CLITE
MSTSSLNFFFFFFFFFLHQGHHHPPPYITVATITSSSSSPSRGHPLHCEVLCRLPPLLSQSPPWPSSFTYGQIEDYTTMTSKARDLLAEAHDAYHSLHHQTTQLPSKHPITSTIILESTWADED